MDTVFSIINIVTAVIALASAVAVVTPTKKDDAFLAKMKPYIDIFALNFGNAKN